jgi:hypothetical protein
LQLRCQVSEPQHHSHSGVGWYCTAYCEAFLHDPEDRSLLGSGFCHCLATADLEQWLLNERHCCRPSCVKPEGVRAACRDTPVPGACDFVWLEWLLPSVCHSCLQALSKDSHQHWVLAEALRASLMCTDILFVLGVLHGILERSAVVGL